MRYAFKAADFGASIVFMAMCAKACWRHFYKDIEQQLQRQKPSLVKKLAIAGPGQGSQVTSAEKAILNK